MHMNVAGPVNDVLSALPREEYERLMPDLESVSLPRGERLYKSGERIEYVYFPAEALISLVTHMTDGAAIEVGLIGRDGMAGIPVLLGTDIAFETAAVQIAGGALRMRSDALKRLLKRPGSPLLTRLLLYTRDLMRQVAKTAACNSRHKIEKRLARWLLMCHDRAGADELPLTSEFICSLLGARHDGAGSAADRLREEGFISYSPGRVTILRRDELERFACECYRASRDEIGRREAREGSRPAPQFPAAESERASARGD